MPGRFGGTGGVLAPSGGSVFGGGGTGGFFGQGGGLSDLIGGVGDFLDIREHQGRIDDIGARAGFQDQGFNFGGLSGNISGTGSTAQLAGPQQGIQNLLAGGGAALFGGQGFDFGQFQNQFGPALGNLAAQSGGINPTAFGQLGNLAGQAQQFGGQAGQAGFANLAAAGNQDALRSQALGTLRNEVQGSGLLDNAINRLQNRQFAQGRLGSTGGAGESRQFLDAVAQQDLGLQSQAFGIGQQQQQILSQLGLGQLGQAQGFMGQAGGFEGQQFGQNLQSGLFGRQGAQGFLDAQAGLFGQGQQAFGQNVGLGLSAFDQFRQRDALTSDTMLGLRQAEADRISAAGQSAQGLAGASGGGGGSFLGGLAKTALSFLPFSDERLKENIKRIGSLGDLGWYEWDWNDKAIELGIKDQPTYGVIAQEVAKIVPNAIVMDASGYLAVNYRELL